MADTFQLKALITGVDKLSPALKGIQKNLRGFKRDLKTAGDGAPAIAAGLAAGVGASLVAFAQSENAAVGLKVAMMDAGGGVSKEFEKINALAIGLGNKLPGTTADFQNMMTMLQRQGLSAEAVLGGVGEATAYLAVQLGKAPEAAAEFAAKMQDATGTASKDMMGLFDVIQKTFYLGVDDSNMLSFFTSASSAMKLLGNDGLKASKAMTPLAVMLDQAGTSGEKAGNAMRKIFTAGFDAKKVKEANRLMSRKGIKLDFTNGKGEFGGIDNLFKQLDKLKGLNSQQKSTIISTIFGDDEAVNTALNTLINKGKVGYDEVQQKMVRQASLQQRVGEQLGTLANLWDAMTGTAVNGLAAIGSAFSGDAKDAVIWLGDLAEQFQNFAAANPEVIRGAVGLAAGFVGVKLALYGANIAMGLLSKTISISPMGLILRGVAMAAGLIIANWSTIGPWFSSLWTSMSSWCAGAWESIKSISATAWEFIKKGFFTFHPIGILIENWGPITGWMSSLWADVSTGFSLAWAFIKQGFMDFSPLGIIIQNWDPIVGWFKTMWERIRPYIEPLINGAKLIGDGLGGAMSGVGGVWDQATKSVGSWFEGDGPKPGLGRNSPLSSPRPAGALQAQQSRQQVNGEMVVRFEDAPPNMRAEPGTSSSPGWSVMPDVGYSRYARN
ncbi:phage tail tape measure protein [Aeromonas salmonicida]|uniref:phage tail tape measure protein n=1 Tax=Aeromonas salmonicida TaxID=645 RepID=UPI0038BAD6AB